MATDPWSAWAETYIEWSTTAMYRRSVDRAMGCVDEAARRGLATRLSWSSGKDSTALLHLVVVSMGLPVRVVHVRDDTAFPGQAEYIEQLQSAWKLDLDIVDNPTSLLDLARASMDRGEDPFERRDHTVPGTGFFRAIRDYYEQNNVALVMLGYRGEESRGRAYRRARGETYTRVDGMTTCCPLVRWSAKDVYAYLLAHSVPLHPFYTRLLPGEDPAMARLDGYFPYCPSWTGDAIRLRRLWPEVYQEMKERFPELGSVS